MKRILYPSPDDPSAGLFYVKIISPCDAVFLRTDKIRFQVAGSKLINDASILITGEKNSRLELKKDSSNLSYF